MVPRQSLTVNFHCEFSSRFHSDSKRIRSGFESKRRESPRIHNVLAQQYGFANFGRVFTVIRCETLSWGIQAEHFRNGSLNFYRHTDGLFTGLVKHGGIPRNFRETAIILILKDQTGDRNSPDNYRGIAISSVLGKLLEKFIMAKYQRFWHTSKQQFGFKAGHGCGMSTFVVQESINYFLENGNEIVFGCFLDLSKAYDRVNHALLFMKLVERHIPTFIVKFLRNWYKEQDLYVKWNSSKSTSFKTSNGVRQGSVLSPALFNVYIDDLITGLERSGAGIRINGRFSGGIAYADDLSLLPTSREGMQMLLEICETFARDHCLKFNVQKNKAIIFRKRRSIYCKETAFSINGESLPEVQDITHLGHKLSAVAGQATAWCCGRALSQVLLFIILDCKDCQRCVWKLYSVVNDNVHHIVTYIGIWVRTVGFWTGKYQTVTISSLEERIS